MVRDQVMRRGCGLLIVRLGGGSYLNGQEDEEHIITGPAMGYSGRDTYLEVGLR